MDKKPEDADKLLKEKRTYLSRRQFIKAGAGTGLALAVLGTAACAERTPTPTPVLTPTSTPIPPTPTPAPHHFLKPSQASVVEAAVARIMPSDANGPGAKEAGVANFIDRALEGYDANLQDTYIGGLAAMDSYSNSKFSKKFVDLTPQQQDGILADMQTGKATGFTTPSAASFFNTLRTYTMLGMFSDPSYGGNQDMVGWKLLGFPGAVFGYSPEEVNTCAPVTRNPVSLQREA